MFKNKKVQIGIGVVLVIALLVGGYFFIAGKSKSKEQTEEVSQEDVVYKLSAKDIGLTIEASSDNKKIKFTVEKLAGIKSIEYEATYEADSTAEEQNEGGEARVQRGITGEAELESGSSYESPWLDLGSCSRNVCRYDKGVESIDLTLKIKKNDGKTYAVQESLSL